MSRTLRMRDPSYRSLVGVGGIGSGMFLALEGEATLGRAESRGARVLDVRDACKLHTVAHHVATLTAVDVVPVGVVGDDDAGRWATGAMRDAGMDVTHVRTDPSRPTLFSVCFQYPDGDGGNVTTVDSAASALEPSGVDAVTDRLDDATIALAQPEVPLATRRRLLELARERGAVTAGSFTAAELSDARSMYELLDVVELNEGEAAALAGVALDASDPEPFLERCAGPFRDDALVVVTAGARGAFGTQGGRVVHRSAPHVEVVSTAGSGDALLAGVLVGLAAGIPLLGEATDPELDDALGLGVLLGSLNATSPHTIHPSADADALAAFARDTARRPVGPLATLFEEDAR